MKVNRTGIGLATAMLVISSAGCGKIADKATKKVTEKGLEKTIESQTGGKVDVDAKDGGFKVETTDGPKVQMGSSASLPAGWPKILALPKGFEVNMATTTKDDETPRKLVMATRSSRPTRRTSRPPVMRSNRSRAPIRAATTRCGNSGPKAGSRTSRSRSRQTTRRLL